MYVPYAFLMMIIVLKPCYEVMNHYVLSHHCLFILLYVPFLHIAYLYPYLDLMVQDISGRWCAHILATPLRMCLSYRTLMLGQQQMSFTMLLMGLPCHHRHLSRS
jgi:hypothetical protein